MRLVPAVLACLVPLSACSSRPWTPGDLDPAELEREFTAQARTVLRDDALVLSSPYDADATDCYAEVVREQAQLVRDVLDAAVAPPLRFYLGALPISDAELPIWARAGRDGVAGANWRPTDGSQAVESFAFVYVTADGSKARMRSAMADRTIRHELTHAYAGREQLGGPIWFAEALAREVEEMSVASGKLRAEVFPGDYVSARASVVTGRLATLLNWRHTDVITGVERTQRYCDARTLLRFLLERTPGATLKERCRSILALPDGFVLALESEWITWLGEHDALAAIRAQLRSESREEHLEAVHALCGLRAAGAEELDTRAADELALGLLTDRELGGRAFDFLYFFRAQALTEVDLERLRISDDPALELSSYALRARRGEPFDLEAARKALEKIPEAERDRRVNTQVLMTPGLRSR